MPGVTEDPFWGGATRFYYYTQHWITNEPKHKRSQKGEPQSNGHKSGVNIYVRVTEPLLPKSPDFRLSTFKPAAASLIPQSLEALSSITAKSVPDNFCRVSKGPLVIRVPKLGCSPEAHEALAQAFSVLVELLFQFVVFACFVLLVLCLFLFLFWGQRQNKLGRQEVGEDLGGVEEGGKYVMEMYHMKKLIIIIIIITSAGL